MYERGRAGLGFGAADRFSRACPLPPSPPQRIYPLFCLSHFFRFACTHSKSGCPYHHRPTPQLFSLPIIIPVALIK
jgi:hypothetical protein